MSVSVYRFFLSDFSVSSALCVIMVLEAALADISLYQRNTWFGIALRSVLISFMMMLLLAMLADSTTLIGCRFFWSEF